MYEEKRIRHALIRNTLLFFIVFALIFTVLGIFVFQMVDANIFKAADAQLNGRSAVSAVFVTEPSMDVSVEGNTPLSETAPSSPTMDIFNNSPEYALPVEPLSEGSTESNPDQEDRTGEVYSYFGGSDASFSLSQEFIEENVEENPQTIYLFRDSEGALLDAYGVRSSYPEYITTISFDKTATEEAYSIAHEGHHFRSLTLLELETTEGNLYYVQAVINVDSEIEILTRFTQTLVIGLLGALIACAAASYFLSRRTIRPIAEAWSKQTEFVQNASHELRTPLTVIQTTQELLLEDPHAKIVDHFEDITLTLEESERLRSLAENLLLLSSADSQNMPLETTPFPLDDLLADTAAVFEIVAEQDNKELTLDLDYGKTLRGDREKIRQVISILLDNALKYTEEGDSISITSREQDGMVSLAIADTGIGMGDDDLEHAFDRFFRADKARSRTNDGMGLGLSLARSILEAHGGSIEIGHHEPKGTRVTIDLPTTQ